MPTLDDMYDAIIQGDTVSITDYLSTLQGSAAQLEKIKSLAFIAIAHNKLDVLKTIIGFNAEVQYPIGWALFYAQQRGNKQMVDYLTTGQ